jgi:hypothetical protein
MFSTPARHRESEKRMEIIRWKKVLHNYFLFFLLQYGLIAMIGTKFRMVFPYKVENDIATFIFITILFGVLMDIGIFIRDFKPTLKITGGLLVAIGAVLQAMFIFQHRTSVLTYKVIILFLVATVVMSIWAIILFFAFDKETMAGLRRKSKKKSAVYYVLAVTIFTYVSTLLLYRYYDHQINGLLAMGTVNRTDGLDAAQVIGLVDAKILQVDLLQTILLVVISVAFLWPYRKWVLGPDTGSEMSQV